MSSDEVREMSEPEGHGRAFDEALIGEFRGNSGRVSGIYANSPLLLLTTIGAKSGQPRTWPLGYGIDGDRIVVIASNDGKSKHPAWYHNLVANPEATVELPGETVAVHARVANGAERDRLFHKLAAEMPAFHDYQRMTTRIIPVVILERVAQ